MKQITLNSGKQVLGSDPYKPGDGLHSEFVGRLHELKMITAAWIGGSSSPPLCPLLIGEPGVGKNRLIYELSRRARLDLFIFQGHEDVTAADIACTVRFSDEPGRSMEYVASPQAHHRWTFEPILKALTPRLSAEHHAFLALLGQALCSSRAMAKLVEAEL